MKSVEARGTVRPRLTPYELQLLAANRTLKQYRPESRWAYNRRINRALRYVCPDDTFRVVATSLFWMALAAFAAGCVIAFPIEFVRWWLCL